MIHNGPVSPFDEPEFLALTEVEICNERSELQRVLELWVGFTAVVTAEKALLVCKYEFARIS